MIATHRRRHALTWLLLGPLLVAMTVLLVIFRPSATHTSAAPTPVAQP